MDNEFQIEIIKKKFGNSEEFSVSARELHKVLEVRRDFTTWIKGRVSKYDFEENSDYIVTSLIHQNGGIKISGKGGDRKSVDYFLTIGVAKELAMVENNEKGRKVRKYFIRVEKEYLNLITKDMTAGALKSWEQLRLEGKYARNSLTDTIKDFIEYAKEQDSKNADRYYSNMTITTYKALTFIEKAGDIDSNFRNSLEKLQLQFLGIAEIIVLKTMEIEMKKKTPYKEVYQIAKNKVLDFVSVVSPVIDLKPKKREEKQGIFEF